MLTAYPTEFPSEAIAFVIPALRGQAVNWPQAAQAGWTVVGYALGQAIPNAPAPARSTSRGKGKALTAKKAAALLEQHVSGTASANAAPDKARAMGAFPWQELVATLLPLILQWATKL